jgi:phenol 2-monooxygenase (NADPH)
MFSGKPAKDAADEAGISMEEFKQTFETGNRFTSGISVIYSPNSIVACSELMCKDATSLGVLRIEARFASFQVVCQSDAVPRQLGEMLISNGSWRLIVFAGDVTKSASKELLRVLGNDLTAQGTVLRRWVRTSAIKLNDQDDVPFLSPTLAHSSAHRDVELLEMPEVYCTRSLQSITHGAEMSLRTWTVSASLQMMRAIITATERSMRIMAWTKSVEEWSWYEQIST